MLPNCSEKKAKRELLRQKLKYKRQITWVILAIGFTYLTVSGQDIEDVNPKVPAFTSLRTSSLASTLSSPSPSPYYSTLGEVSSSVVYSNSTERNNDLSSLVAGVNCTPPAINEFPPDLFTQAERQQGGVVFHVFISIYIFYAIALVCDDYFVPAIETICEALHLPSDVAGATFMAIATSAPELFTNVIGTFVTHGDIGVGTIVGSAVFNILAVSACCGLASKKALQLEWWSLSRDCFFYAVSVIFLLIVLSNRQVFWYEALVLVLLYGAYIFVMYHNAACKRFAESIVYGRFNQKKYNKIPGNSSQKILSNNGADMEKAPLIDETSTSGKSNILYSNDRSFLEIGGTHSPIESKISNSDNEENELELSSDELDELLIARALQKIENDAEEEKEEWGLFKLPFGEGIIKWIEWIVGWPARFCLVMTVPDCREHRFRKWYPLTFVMCIIWIAVLTYLMSWMMTVIGHTLSIPDSVMGLTFIAAGTSVPEAVSSIIVSRQGLGAMGISNSIGSNTFDILICLGLPWLIRGSMLANSETNYVEIISGGLEYSTILLIGSVIVLYVMLASNKFVLNKKIGIMSFTMYGIFLIISSLFELNVFMQVNRPTCDM